MLKLLKVFFASIGVLIALILTLAVVGIWTMSHKGYAFPDQDLASHLADRWDWTTRAHPCGDSSHVISFSANRKTMTISEPPHLADTGWTATYDLLKLEPTRLRGAIRGEDRLTTNGKPVVWDLVMFGPDEYRWQRTDWMPWSYTAAIIRCGPVEKDTT